MAVGTQVRNTQDLRLSIAQEATLGAGSTRSGTSHFEYSLLSPPTFRDISGERQSVSTITGYTESLNYSHVSSQNQMIEISFSTLLTPTALDQLCLFMFEDGDGVNSFSGSYRPHTMTSSTETDFSAIIRIKGSGYDTTAGQNKAEIRYLGCMMTSLTINHAIDSEAGLPTADVTFVTGYPPTYSDDWNDGAYSGGTKLTGSAPHFTEWTTTGNATAIIGGGNTIHIHPYSYNISVSKELSRVGEYTSSASNAPFGYAMTGDLSAEMNMIYKRDENFHNIKDLVTTNSTIQMMIGDNSNWDFKIAGLVSESSIETGSAELRNGLTIKGLRRGLNDYILSLEM